MQRPIAKDIVAAEIQFEDLTNQIQTQENAVRDEAHCKPPFRLKRAVRMGAKPRGP